MCDDRCCDSSYINQEEEEEDMSNGREHAERRLAQARAAAKPENKARAAKRPGKGNRNRWKKEEY